MPITPNNQLVDCGANGGLAGSDMRVIYKTHRKINISGIDNHEVNGLDVVTAATLLNTSLGKVIGIFNEYAPSWEGIIHPIHQVNLNGSRLMLMKSLSKLVVPKLITTLDGYSVPLPHQGWFGLCHLPWKTHRSGYGHIPTCSSSHLLMNGILQYLTMILHPLMDWTPVKCLTSLLVTPCLMLMEISMSASLANLNILLDAPPEDYGSYIAQSSSGFIPRA